MERLPRSGTLRGAWLRSLDGSSPWQRATAKALLFLGAEAWSFLCAKFLGLFWESFQDE